MRHKPPEEFNEEKVVADGKTWNRSETAEQYLRLLYHDLIFFIDPDRHDDKFVLDELVRVRELCLLFYILTEKLRKSSSF